MKANKILTIRYAQHYHIDFWYDSAQYPKIILSIGTDRPKQTV